MFLHVYAYVYVYGMNMCGGMFTSLWVYDKGECTGVLLEYL